MTVLVVNPAPLSVSVTVSSDESGSSAGVMSNSWESSQFVVVKASDAGMTVIFPASLPMRVTVTVTSVEGAERSLTSRPAWRPSSTSTESFDSMSITGVPSGGSSTSSRSIATAIVSVPPLESSALTTTA